MEIMIHPTSIKKTEIGSERTKLFLKISNRRVQFVRLRKPQKTPENTRNAFTKVTTGVMIQFTRGYDRS
jgi:hypothetical protein